MVSSIATELGKIAVEKLSSVKAEDAARAVSALSKGSLSVATLVPGAGVFALGVALGAGLGVLFAPRPGRETRAAVKDAVRGRIGALRARLSSAR